MRLRRDDLLPGGVEKHFEVKPRSDRHVRPPRTTAEPTIRPQKPTAPNLGLLQMRPCSLLELDDGAVTGRSARCTRSRCCSAAVPSCQVAATARTIYAWRTDTAAPPSTKHLRARRSGTRHPMDLEVLPRNNGPWVRFRKKAALYFAKKKGRNCTIPNFKPIEPASALSHCRSCHLIVMWSATLSSSGRRDYFCRSRTRGSAMMSARPYR
jgi:hypothetical protein